MRFARNISQPIFVSHREVFHPHLPASGEIRASANLDIPIPDLRHANTRASIMSIRGVSNLSIIRSRKKYMKHSFFRHNPSLAERRQNPRVGISPTRCFPRLGVVFLNKSCSRQSVCFLNFLRFIFVSPPSIQNPATIRDHWGKIARPL